MNHTAFCVTSVPCGLGLRYDIVRHGISRPQSLRLSRSHRSRIYTPTIRSELTQNETAKKSEERMNKTIDSVQTNFNTVRTGRASPSILDRVLVSYYGADTPLNQLASVSVSGTSTLVVEPYDKNAIQDVEKAIMQSDVGITPNSDGSKIRLAVPQLTEERRKELAKQVKAIAEEGRIAIRNIRRDAVDALKKQEKKNNLGKDESMTMQDEVQKLTDKYIKQVDKMLKQKEADIMKV
ncbi:Ribosome-recycling factor [Gracilariopsis chorda]|uniref:Ribosome-recycling factor n=1 Tax=Gracilariopsis chorda TaxID=448386 RepID=A0A2V3INL6_9FLOR|nr:Ribosome-recycling factor [Gracilariopsis chorda]|eukprot:PXF43676.1 Ribosome-recycling factor [Gracilariopsis chorda]